MPEDKRAKCEDAWAWMGFEARQAILDVLDEAIADKTASVKFIAYDLNEPEVVRRLEALGTRLQVIIDNSKDHGEAGSAENVAEQRLKAIAGDANVLRQKMLNLQHNKMIVVDGKKCQAVICGSTNYSWRAFYVQNNNAVVLRGPNPVAIFKASFEKILDEHARRVSGFGSNRLDKFAHGLIECGGDLLSAFKLERRASQRCRGRPSQ